MTDQVDKTGKMYFDTALTFMDDPDTLEIAVGFLQVSCRLSNNACRATTLGDVYYRLAVREGGGGEHPQHIDMSYLEQAITHYRIAMRLNPEYHEAQTQCLKAYDILVSAKNHVIDDLTRITE